jgi:chromosome segregation ATPase
MDVSSRDERIEKIMDNEKNLRTELLRLKENCEYLLQQNRELELGYHQQSQPHRAPKIMHALEPSRNSPPIDHVARVSSLYKQFLFPFRGRSEVEKMIKKLKEYLGRNDGGSIPAMKLFDTLESRICDLMNACEKLEVSAYCLIKSDTKSAV